MNIINFLSSTKIFIFIIIVYIISRLINLTSLPIFIDEAMYINWGRLINENPKQNLFISLTDGQQPFFIWLTTISYFLNQDNFLLSGRLISVFSGLGTVILIFFLGKEIFNPKIGLVASFLYAVSPFTLWYDRLAIKDSFLMLLSGLILFLSLKFSKTLKWHYSLVLGLVLGIALLTKSISYFFVFLTPLTIFLFNLNLSLNTTLTTFKKLLPKILVVLVFAFAIQTVMYLSSAINSIGPKNSVFLLSTKEITNLPLNLWFRNIYLTFNWWLGYYSLPIMIIGGLGIVFLIKNSQKRAGILLSWIVLPIIFEMLTAKIFFPRYFLFTFVAWSLLVAFGLSICFSHLKSKILKVIFLLLCIFPSVQLDKQILFNVTQAKLPKIERWQYIEGWPAGFGVKELANYISTNFLDQSQELLVITEKETLVPSSLPLYLKKFPNFEIQLLIEVGKPTNQFPLAALTDQRQVIIILNQNEKLPENWPFKGVTKISRFNSDKYFSIYQKDLSLIN